MTDDVAMLLTTEEARRILTTMNAVFDVVRFVDPIGRVVLIPTDEGWKRAGQEACYNVWNKSLRCENCVSLRAHNAQKRMTKYEFIGSNVYNAVSRPVTIVETTGRTFDCCLEMVCEITDEVFFTAFDKDEIITKIIESERRVYTDSLTGVYNRRFYDELAFCHRRGFDIGSAVAFVMADFKGFKQINDQFGHDAGDATLRRAAEAMKDCVRAQDAVIRMGGDEFLIVLADCDEKAACEVIRKINESFNRPSIRPDGEPLACNFGIAATARFREDMAFIDQLLNSADQNMYEDKRRVGRQG
jgi:putative two-component system response regulator